MNNIFKQNTVHAIFFEVTTDLLNSENLKVAIAQLYKELQVCDFTMLYLAQKQLNNIFKENTLNAIVFKLQAIYSTVRT